MHIGNLKKALQQIDLVFLLEYPPIGGLNING